MKKTTAIIFNIVIALICAASIAGYFVMPFWKVEAKFTMTDDLADYIEQDIIASMKTSEDNSEIDVKQMATDVVESLREERFSIRLSAELKTIDFLYALAYRDTESIENTVNTVVDSFISSISNEIDAALKTVSKSAVKSAAKVTVAQVLEDYNAEEVLSELGIDDEYLNNSIDKIYDILSSDDATVENVTDAIIEIFDEVVANIEESEYADKIGEITDEDREEIREQVEKALAEIADEDGRIDIEGLVLKYIGLLDETDGGSGAETESEPNSELSALRYVFGANTAFADEENTGKTTTTDEVKERLKNSIMKSLSSGNNEILLYVMMGIGIWILITLLVWVYLIIKILVKSFTQRPCIKLKAAIWFGYSPYVLLVLFPTIISLIFTKFDLFGSILSILTAKALTFIGAFKLSFFSGGIVSFIGAMALIVIWIFYRGIRKGFNKK